MNNFENDIVNCINVLQRGGMILYPTDTIWGIGCDATNEQAVARIFDLKKRSEEKSMIILVAEEKRISDYVVAPDQRLFDYLHKTVKPTTVIYTNVTGIARNAVNKDGSVAIRICKDEFCAELINRFQKPIISTSANISGEPSPAIFTDVSDEIKIGVDYVVKYKQAETGTNAPSSIIRWNDDGMIEVLRP